MYASTQELDPPWRINVDDPYMSWKLSKLDCLGTHSNNLIEPATLDVQCGQRCRNSTKVFMLKISNLEYYKILLDYRDTCPLGQLWQHCNAACGCEDHGSFHLGCWLPDPSHAYRCVQNNHAGKTSFGPLWQPVHSHMSACLGLIWSRV